jgi:hypothetical protein
MDKIETGECQLFLEFEIVADLRIAHRNQSPRLLTRGQAAAYCGISLATFKLVCPVRPIALGASKRMQRFDVVALDAWIDSLTADKGTSGRDWLAALEAGRDGRSR